MGGISLRSVGDRTKDQGPSSGFFSLVLRPLFLAVSPQLWRVSDGCRKEGPEGVMSESLHRLPCIFVRCLLAGDVCPSVIRLLHTLLERFLPYLPRYGPREGVASNYVMTRRGYDHADKSLCRHSK